MYGVYCACRVEVGEIVEGRSELSRFDLKLIYFPSKVLSHSLRR
jgi:hypothetical protein